MSLSNGERNPVECLAEEFLERHRRGERPALTEYVDRHPEWAEEIRQVFPALVLMERLKPATGDVTGTFLTGVQPRVGQVPERLGDFRILREVGRGGMGIVYEAEQESLGRHVALKVLPSHALLNPRHLQRFLREARSAARLHHTNIVPVFGVGEADGLHYYVMQFIAGSGVHEVVDELRQFKAANRLAPAADADPAHEEGLLEITQGSPTGRSSAPAATVLGDSGAGPAAAPHGPRAPESRPASEILSGSGANFAKAVARVGLQVAEALAYAHGQGVLHRDIKPSNLLLDFQGTAWVADFGLAKAAEDGDDLSVDGNLLGTLRYMAPERFEGKADARSDLYALGLTLYELLTLRPAFDQTDRDRLIHQVTTEVPPRPRTLDPAIPRDLETIVLKAIEHDPARRYQDASELADDLERFVADRPIQARSVGGIERAWKWARRKPAIAGLMVALTVSLVGGFVGVTWQWRQAVAAGDDARASASKAQTNATHARETVNTFCTLVSEEQLLDQPGMQPLRRRLLGLALKYYQTFRGQQGDDPALMKELAEAAMRSGMIADELGDVNEAYVAFLRAKDILKAQSLRYPDDVAIRLLLARCCIEIEDANRSNDLSYIHVATAIRDFEGKTLMEPLVVADPHNLDYLRLLGRSYHMNAWTDFRGGRASASAVHARKAIDTLEEVRRAAPEDWEAAGWLAAAYSDLAFLDGQVGQRADPVLSFGRALTLFEAIERRFPTSRRRRLDRAQCLVQLALARIDLGRFGEAATDLRDAHDRLGRLHREDPDTVDVRYWLAVSKRGLGQVAMALGSSDAGPLLREAIGLHEAVPAESLAGRDMIELGWSYLWLGRADFLAGRRDEIPALRVKLATTLGAVKQRSLVGFPLPTQSSEIARIEDLVGLFLTSDRDTPPAEQIAADRQRVRDRQSRVDKQPADPVLRYQIGWGLAQLAEVLLREGQVVEARSTLVVSLTSLEELVRVDPKNLRWKHGLARALEIQARVEARTARPVEARAAAGRAVAIAEELARTDPAYFYELACMLNVRELVSPSEAHAASAIAALHRAIDAGFDNDHLLRTDGRLDGLRSRPDFPASIRSSKRR